ncbi:MAG TPA: hypothetical protein VEK85_04710 [Gemmatimonadales bacterium]|nr:hypothetical protein [Gemmatimonadales bacterium]
MPRIRLLLVWVVCVGAGLAAVRLAPAAVASWQSRRQALLLESIRVITRAGAFPSIEITLRNPAPSISFLTTLDAEVATRLHRGQAGDCSEDPAVWDYDLLLDGRRAAQHDRVTLSQLVDPASLHRFAIAVGQGGPPTHGEYDIALTLRYNEGATLPLGHVELSIDRPACGLAPGGRPARPMRVERLRLPKA